MTTKHPASVRLNLEVSAALKEEIRSEAARAGLSMTQIIKRAWLLYRRCQQGGLYTVVKNDMTKLEIL